MVGAVDSLCRTSLSHKMLILCICINMHLRRAHSSYLQHVHVCMHGGVQTSPSKQWRKSAVPAEHCGIVNPSGGRGGSRVEHPHIHNILITSLRGQRSGGSVSCCYLFLTRCPLVCRVYLEMHLGATELNTESQEDFYFSCWSTPKATQKNVRVCVCAHMSE